MQFAASSSAISDTSHCFPPSRVCAGAPDHSIRQRPRHDQIAIQSPAGGTTIAWDGPAEPSAAGWARQRFDLVATDPRSEIQRLRELGATLLPAGSGFVTLADPDGSEFSLRHG